METRTEIEAFLKHSRQPALLEPGEELLPLTGENLELDVRGDRLTLQAWDRTRNLMRRVTGIRKLKFLHLLLPGQRFTVTVESPRDDAVRFLCRRGEVLLAEGRLYLAPLADSANGSPY